MKYTLYTEIEFYASLGYVQGNRETSMTLLEMGLDEEDLINMSEKEVEEFIDENYEIWLSENLNAGWDVKE